MEEKDKTAFNVKPTGKNVVEGVEKLNVKKINFYAMTFFLFVFGGAMLFKPSYKKPTKKSGAPGKEVLSVGSVVDTFPKGYEDIKYREPQIKEKNAKIRTKESQEEIIRKTEEIESLKNSFRSKRDSLSFKGLNLKELMITDEEFKRSKTGLNLSLKNENKLIESKFISNKTRVTRSRPEGKYSLMMGTVVHALLETGLNSDLPGKIRGKISQDVYDFSGRYVLIPQDAKLYGEYQSQIIYGQERIFATFSRIVFPDESWLDLNEMPGVDMSGYAGFGATVDNHFLDIAKNVVLGVVAGAGAQVAIGGSRTQNPTFGQLASEGAATQINSTLQQIISRQLRVQPTLKKEPGERISVFVTKDIYLEPYLN